MPGSDDGKTRHVGLHVHGQRKGIIELKVSEGKCFVLKLNELDRYGADRIERGEASLRS